MNHYQFEDIYVGLKEEFQVTVSEEMLTQFCSITKDVNPLHTDETFAKEKGYDSKVAYGMLTASFLSTLAVRLKYSLLSSFFCAHSSLITAL